MRAVLHHGTVVEDGWGGMWVLSRRVRRKSRRKSRGAHLPLRVHPSLKCVCLCSKLVACYSERENRQRSPEYIGPRLPWRAPGRPIVGLRAALLKSVGGGAVLQRAGRRDYGGESGAGDVGCRYAGTQPHNTHMFTHAHVRTCTCNRQHPSILAPVRLAASPPCEEFLQLKFRFFSVLHHTVETSFDFAPCSQSSLINVNNVHISEDYKCVSAFICGGKLF